MAEKTNEQAAQNRARARSRACERRTWNKREERVRNLKNVQKYRAKINGKEARVDEDGYLHLGAMTHVCAHCGALHWLFERSKTAGSSLKFPKFHKCCFNGQIVPQNLHSSVCLQCSTHFRDQNGNIRAPEPHDICSSCDSIVPQPLPTFEDPPLLLRMLLTSQCTLAQSDFARIFVSITMRWRWDLCVQTLCQEALDRLHTIRPLQFKDVCIIRSAP